MLQYIFCLCKNTCGCCIANFATARMLPCVFLHILSEICSILVVLSNSKEPCFCLASLHTRIKQQNFQTSITVISNDLIPHMETLHDPLSQQGISRLSQPKPPAESKLLTSLAEAVLSCPTSLTSRSREIAEAIVTWPC